MLEHLCLNMKLLMMCWRRSKSRSYGQHFLQWKYHWWEPEWWVSDNFNFKKDKEDFTQWCRDEEHATEALTDFQGDAYGIWEQAFKRSMMVAVAVKVPIVDGTFHTIKHPAVIALLEYYFQR